MNNEGMNESSESNESIKQSLKTEMNCQSIHHMRVGTTGIDFL